jgi:hypothetical protein
VDQFASGIHSVSFRSIIQPATTLLAQLDPQYSQRSAVRSQAVGHNDHWAAVPLHRSAHKLKRCFAVSTFGSKDFDDLTFVINGPP